MTNPSPKPPHDDNAIRPHVYDGIAEYDRRMPNWWLFTLFATIVFSIGYWGYYEWLRAGPDGVQKVTRELALIEAARLAAAPAADDGSLWKMSRNDVFIAAGRVTYDTTCASCHHLNLTGGIGPNLVDTTWVHGGRPAEIFEVVEKGVLAKGMPAWGSILGPRKTAEVVAYILSHHPEGDVLATTTP